MLVTIEKSYDNGFVDVQSPYGTFNGKYYGKRACKNCLCDVEIEVSKVCVPDDIQISESETYLITKTNGKFIINGWVEDVEDDVLYLRLGLDLIAIEILPSDEYQVLKNKYVRLTLDFLELFDTGVPC